MDSPSIIPRRPPLAAIDPHLLWMGHRILCHGGVACRGTLNAAFTASIGLLAAFMIADKIFKEY